MKRNILIAFISILTVGLLSACGSGGKKVELTDYLELDFSGMDTIGTADYQFDFAAAVEDSYKFKESYETEMSKLSEKKPEIVEEIVGASNSYSIDLDKTDGLANGDKVVATIKMAEAYEDQFQGGEKEFTVEGLEEPETLSTEELKKHIIVDFIGVSGKGKARIENTFNDELSSVSFTVENDGELKNGDKAKLTVNEENRALIDFGYKLADEADLTYEVKELDEVAEKASDIKNLKDVKRFIKEEVEKKFPNTRSLSSISRYDVEEVTSLYRQFKPEDENSGWGNTDDQHGSFITLYKIKHYENEDDQKNKDVADESVYVYGYEGMKLDDDKKVNIPKLKVFSEGHDKSYSLETVQQIYEGNGYEEVK